MFGGGSAWSLLLSCSFGSQDGARLSRTYHGTARRVQARHLKAELEERPVVREEEREAAAMAKAMEHGSSGFADQLRDIAPARGAVRPPLGVLGTAVLEVCRNIETTPEAASGDGDMDWLWVQLDVQQAKDELGIPLPPPQPLCPCVTNWCTNSRFLLS